MTRCLGPAALLLCILPLSTVQAAPGLTSVRFHEADFTRPDRVEPAEQVYLDTGTAHGSYSQVWLGSLRMQVTGDVKLTAEADDGLVVTLAGKQVLNGWRGPEREARILAREGEVVPLEVRFFQNGGTAHCRLFWSWTGHGREIIPAAAFNHTDADRQRAEALVSGREKLEPPAAHAEPPAVARAPVTAWQPGDWLLLDERNILSVENLQRVTGQPVRHGAPLVDGETDGNFQPYVTVVRGTGGDRWRMWYNVPKTKGNWGESSLALLESANGIQWERPHRILETPPIQFGASVVDEGPSCMNPAQRYKAAWHRDNGLQVAVSADGLKWSLIAPGPVLRHNHDIDAIDWDPLRRHYMAFVSVAAKLDPSWSGARRIPHMSVSEDLVHWREPWPVVMPDAGSPREQGDTQFYCMAGVIERGGLLIGLVKILRDDLNAEPGMTAADLGDSRPHAGIGYTVLAWSADGARWRRDTEPFLDRNPAPGSWDRAHAWADEQVLNGDELFLYYAGYRLGHKAERFTTRQIGLARMKRDRYAGFAAAPASPGMLRLPARRWDARSFTLNASAAGEVRVALCEPSGRFLPGFSFADCRPVQGDCVALPVAWTGEPGSLIGKDVQPVIQVTGGTVYAIGLK